VESLGAHKKSLRALMSDAPSESEVQCRSTQGKSSTSSPATTPEMLESEVTPGLLAGAEPNTHQFNVMIFRRVIKWKKTQNSIVSTLKLGRACMGE
jgi:hypothetical protein